MSILNEIKKYIKQKLCDHICMIKVAQSKYYNTYVCRKCEYKEM